MVVVVLTVSIIIITVPLAIHYCNGRRRRLVLPNLASKAHKEAKRIATLLQWAVTNQVQNILDPGYDAIKPIKTLDKRNTGSNESSRNEDIDDDPSKADSPNKPTYSDVSLSASIKPSTRHTTCMIMSHPNFPRRI